MAIVLGPAAAAAGTVGAAGGAKATGTALTTAALVAGTAISAAGALQAASGQADALNLEADTLDQQAERDRAQAKIDADEKRRDSRRLLANQIALLGGSGVQFSGTPSLLISDTAAEGEFQALQTEVGGEVFATRKEQTADLRRSSASSVKSAGTTRAGSLLLTGASQLNSFTR